MIRISGEQALLTIKGAGSGITRTEFEYGIPFKDAEQMLNELCEKPTIKKDRHYVSIGNHTWEVDEFYGENEGLTFAEIELSSEDETFEKPSWVGEEVTGDVRYFNANLIRKPFSSW